ncbi:MAG: hypothetical protein ABSC24_04715 [Verrucomicrobiota bacterium]|jgi:hypothetical protein
MKVLLTLAGKWQEARLANEKTMGLNKAQPDPDFDSECFENIPMVNAIPGKSP